MAQVGDVVLSKLYATGSTEVWTQGEDEVHEFLISTRRALLFQELADFACEPSYSGSHPPEKQLDR